MQETPHTRQLLQQAIARMKGQLQTKIQSMVVKPTPNAKTLRLSCWPLPVPIFACQAAIHNSGFCSRFAMIATKRCVCQAILCSSDQPLHTDCSLGCLRSEERRSECLEQEIGQLYQRRFAQIPKLHLII